ncbi:MAG: MFS transporter [Bacilli bacterium]|nr:MFS transporter [Bacilli bacterium]
MKQEQKVLITISALKTIMSIFLGPFLTAYFLKTSKEGVMSLSEYYMISYFFLGLLTLVIAVIVNRKYRIEMYRFGVILNFIYMLAIVLLQDRIIKYLPFVAMLNGIALSTYWYPYNIFMANKIDNKDRTRFTTVNNIVGSIVGIVTPLLLGAIITTSNFESTAIIIAILSAIVIVLSFFIKTEKDYKLPDVTYLETWDYLKKYKAIRKTYFTELLIGFAASDGALSILTTVIIFNSFKTDMNLGIITSIATVLKILYIQFYQKKFKGKKDKGIIIFSSIVPAISLFLLLFFPTNITMVLYNICFTVFAGLLGMIAEIRMYNICNSNLLDEDKQIEFLAIKELILNIGRVLSYELVIILSFLQIPNSLNVLLILLTIGMVYMGYNISKLNKYENVQKEEVI